MSNLKDFTGKDGKLVSFAWPGGYPIIYLCKDGGVVCPQCANENDWNGEQGVENGDIFWEGPAMSCDNCNAEIESAYGDPDEDNPK